MMVSVSDESQDLVIDFSGVSLRRDGATLVGPLDWQVELDERWVVIGPNGAGKTTLMRLASAEAFPSTGEATLLGERIGRTDMRDLRSLIGVSSSAVANRMPANELVQDLVISA